MRKRREELSRAYAGLTAGQIEGRIEQSLKNDPLWKKPGREKAPEERPDAFGFSPEFKPGYMGEQQTDLTYDNLLDLYFSLLPLSPETADLVRDDLATGKRSLLALRIMLLPCCLAQMVCAVGQCPGIAMPLGALMFMASWVEMRYIMHALNAVLGTTKSGKALCRKWKRLFLDAKFFLIMGSLRASLGAKNLAKIGPEELTPVLREEEPTSQWAKEMREWRSARCKTRFDRWYVKRRDVFLQKSADLIGQMDVVWREQIAIFEGVVAQISGPTAPVPLATIVGRIPARWRCVQKEAEAYLSNNPEQQWPESQNRFAKLLSTNSSTLRKAIQKAPKGSLLRSWDEQKNEWKQNKRRTRGGQPDKPAVISLQDAPEPISDRRDVEDEAEVRALLDQHSKERLEEMLEDLFVKTTNKLGRPNSEIRREWSEVKRECTDKEAVANLIILLRQQYRDMFDTDSNTKAKRRRKP